MRQKAAVGANLRVGFVPAGRRVRSKAARALFDTLFPTAANLGRPTPLSEDLFAISYRLRPARREIGAAPSRVSRRGENAATS
jgi:hypothetical protein